MIQYEDVQNSYIVGYYRNIFEILHMHVNSKTSTSIYIYISLQYLLASQVIAININQ